MGATDREGSVGRAVVRNLQSEFDGVLVPATSGRETVFGELALDSMGDADADLAVVVVPPDVVVPVVREVGEAGIRSVVVITVGFGEAGSDGAARESAPAEVAAECDIDPTYGMGTDLDRVLATADAFGDRLVGVPFDDVSDSAFDGLERDAVPSWSVAASRLSGCFRTIAASRARMPTTSPGSSARTSLSKATATPTSSGS